jgi:hypothetical protein
MAGMLSTLVVLSSCRTEYTTQHFSFPPTSKPHEGNWEYTGLVVVSSTRSPITERSRKRIRIRIYDKAGTDLLDDSMGCDCASIRASAVWEKFDDFELTLVEVEKPVRADHNSGQVEESAHRELFKLKYHYNQQGKRFEMVSDVALAPSP